MKVNPGLVKVAAQLALGSKWEVKRAEIAGDGESISFTAVNKDDTVEIKGKIKAPPQEELPLGDDDDAGKVTPIKGAH